MNYNLLKVVSVYYKNTATNALSIEIFFSSTLQSGFTANGSET